MKRFISFILILSIGLVLVACGQSTEVESTIQEEANNSDAERIAELERELAELKENNQWPINEESDQSEEVPEEPDMLEQYIMDLVVEPVEMVMGETCSVELEQEIPNARWSSSDETIVQAADGQLKALMPGTATVTLSTEVKDIPFEVVVNTLPDLTLAVDCSTTIEMNDAVSDVRWESSAPEIVSVEDGVITSLTSGASNITAYIGETPYTFEVVATTPDITTTSVRKIIGNTEQVSILGTNGKVEWKSDNTAIATVSDTGLITAEGTGAGQSTVVHAYVDGMEFKIDVAVEPIPQLSSTYKIYGHNSDATYKDSKIVLCANANEIKKYDFKYETQGTYYSDSADIIFRSETQTVLNVADADYSDGWTLPLYRFFYGKLSDNYMEVYLVGTSQTADVLVQPIESGSRSKVDEDVNYNDASEMFADGFGVIRYGGMSEFDPTVTYEPCENYGIIRVYGRSSRDHLVTVSVDGYRYQFVMSVLKLSNTEGSGYFSYAYIDKIPADYMIEECSVGEVVYSDKVNFNYDSLSSNSRTYFGGNEWVERIGTKFVEAVEDEAISMVAGYLLKTIFL